MKIARLKELVDKGFDIEFEYEGRTYWITWSNVTGENLLYFYEDNAGDDVSFKNAEELIAGEYHGMKIEEIWEKLEAKDLWI